MQKLEELKHGCIAKAADDELVFVLRAQDAIAPATIRFWAEQFRNVNSTPAFFINRSSLQDDGRIWRSKQAKEKYEDAICCANSMERHPNRKLPD